MEIIRNIASVMLIPTQLGGGMRDIETIQKMLTLGIERVILGTVAVENPRLVEEACKRFNDYIIVSIDARDGYVATRGWVQETTLTTVKFAQQMANLGARRFIYTDIVRAGWFRWARGRTRTGRRSIARCWRKNQKASSRR